MDFILLVLKFFVVFLLPGSVTFLVFLRLGLRSYVSPYIAGLLALGTGPLINALTFYYVLWFLPGQDAATYTFIVTALWAVTFLATHSVWRDAVNVVRQLPMKWVQYGVHPVIYLVVAIMMLIFMVQSVVYPIAENDSAAYLNQSEAIYEYRNFTWRTEPHVVIRGDDYIHYNAMIRPAIPHMMAYSFFWGRTDYDDVLFRILTTYYYVLMIGMFVAMATVLASELGLSKQKAAGYGLLFVTFTWEFAHSVAYNLKESIIYFLILASLYVLYQVVQRNDRSWRLEILLGLLLGVNSFINFHGTIIVAFVLLLLLLFSRHSFKVRFKQIVGLLLSVNILGAFEFINFYLFKVVYAAVKVRVVAALAFVWNPLAEKFTTWFVPQYEPISVFNSGGEPVIVDPVVLPEAVETSVRGIESLTGEDAGHQELYQFSGILSEYLRGRLQVLTNIGVFGIYFWVFLGVVTTRFKTVVKSRLARMLLVFMVLYFIIVIDLFHVNPAKAAVVLAGSTKYAGLMLLCGLLFVSVYADRLFTRLSAVVQRYSKLALVLSGVVLLVGISAFTPITELMTQVLLNVIPTFKEFSYYQAIMARLLMAGLIGVVVLIGIVGLFMKQRSQLATKGLVVLSIAVFVITPFLAAPFGKVPTSRTFEYVTASQTDTLKNTLFHGSEFAMYEYVRAMSEPGSVLFIPSNTLFTYDDHFQMIRSVTYVERRVKGLQLDYAIVYGECVESERIHTIENVHLCQYIR